MRTRIDFALLNSVGESTAQVAGAETIGQIDSLDLVRKIIGGTVEMVATTPTRAGR